MISILLFTLMAGRIDAVIPLGTDWAIKQDPSKGMVDAVVLEHTTTIRNDNIKFYRRIRILSERGKTAANLQNPAGDALYISGKVHLPDGSVTPFSAKTDLVEVLLYKTRYGKEKGKYLIPPGLTTNCIVEMEWSRPATDGLTDGYVKQYFVAEPYYVLKKSFILTSDALKSQVFRTNHIWTQLTDPERFDVVKGKKETTVTYKQFPPQDAFPYGNPYQDDNDAFFMSYAAYHGYPNEIQAFWAEFVARGIKGKFDIQVKGEKYKNWIRELKAQPTTSPKDRLTHLSTQLRERLASTRLPHYSQHQLIKEQPSELGEAFDKGYATTHQLAQIFYCAARDLEIPFQLIFPSDATEGDFNPKQGLASVLNYSYPVLGVMEAKQLHLFTPYFYEEDLGQLPSYHEGSNALVVYPSKTWTGNVIMIPVSTPESNTFSTQIKARLEPSGQFTHDISRTVTGHYASRFRRAYYSLPPEEKEHLLYEEWQAAMPDAHVLEPKVEGIETLGTPVVEKVRLEQEINLTELGFLEIAPFPNSHRIAKDHEYWPENRTQDIYLDFPAVHSDQLTLEVPPGWTLKGENNWERSNFLGQVKVTANQSGNIITVTRRRELKHSRLTRKAEEHLKTWLAWTHEALDQNIAITRTEVAP